MIYTTEFSASSHMWPNMQLKDKHTSEDKKGWLSQTANKVKVVELSIFFLSKFSNTFQMFSVFRFIKEKCVGVPFTEMDEQFEGKIEE